MSALIEAQLDVSIHTNSSPGLRRRREEKRRRRTCERRYDSKREKERAIEEGELG